MTPAEPNPRPGDAIGFSGTDFVSDAINLGTLGWPRWGISHIAIVTEHPEHGICLAESTTMASQPCLIRGERVNGAQFQPIKRRVNEYAGRVWHYPLRVPIGPPMTRELNIALVDLVENECGYDYLGAVRSRSMIYAMIRRWKYGREDLETLFCSELVALAWSRFDLFETTNVSGWNPNALIRAARKQNIIVPPYRWK